MAAKFNKLESDYQSLLTECGILKCKLECKTEALIILSHELDRNRSERDQYKLMADQLRERYSALKKRVEGWGPSLLGVYDVHGLKGEREQSLVQLLCELKEQNKSLQFEVDDLKQRLMDTQGDIKILREKMTQKDSNSLYDEHSVCKQFPPCEREELVGQLEIMRNKGLLLERDLQAVLDEKEELVTARDAYRHKFERLNQQLNCILRGDQQTVVDIDGVVMENRYLQERIKQVQEEKTMISATLSKCRAMLEKKRPRNNQRFNAISSGLAIGAKQVEQLLQNNPFLETSNNSADLRNLIMTLLEALSDKALALSHQKKTNKLLGNRIAELEQKVKTIKAPPFWQDSGQLTYLLRSTSAEDSQSIDNTSLSPQHSVSSPGSIPPIPVNYLPPMSSETASEERLLCVKVDDEFSISQLGRSNSCFSDLDFLPTKENVSKEYELSRSESISSCSSHVSEPKSNTPTSRMPYHRTSGVCIAKESSPLKSVLRTSSINSLHKAISFSEKPKSPDLDLDDLPPKLQKLLSAALAEIEQQSSSQRKSKSPSPVHDRNAKKDIDPSC